MGKGKTDEKILDAAVKMFADRGYTATTTKQIAEEAGIAEGTIFRYYKTKNDILVKALDKVIATFSDEKAFKPMSKILEENKSATPEVVLKALIIDRIAVFKVHNDVLRAVFTESQYNPDISEKLYFALSNRILPILLDFLDRGTAAGVFKKMDRDEKLIVLRILISMIVGYVFQRGYAPKFIMMDESKDIDKMIEIFLDGIRV